LTTVREGVYTSRALKNKPATNPLDKLPPVLKKDLRRDLCTCNQVLKIDIINAIIDGATTVEAVKKQTYATMGSGCCKQQVERLIECLCSPDAEE
jgi:NAD(P)H-nitrite reductase large subunit